MGNAQETVIAFLYANKFPENTRQLTGNMNALIQVANLWKLNLGQPWAQNLAYLETYARMPKEKTQLINAVNQLIKLFYKI